MAVPARKSAPQPSRGKGPVVQLRKETWYPLVADYLAWVAQRNRTAKTIANYRQALDDFARYARGAGITTLNVREITREQIGAYIADMFDRRRLAANSVTKHIKALKQFLAWCVDEGELDRNPGARVMLPMVPEDQEPPPVFTDVELKKLFATCEKGRDFQSVRDYAVLCLLLSTGIRRGELANLRFGDFAWDEQTVTVHGKGRRHRKLNYGKYADDALRRYRRHRQAREDATDEKDAPWWYGHQGPLGYHGLYLIVRRRAAEAGLGDKWPHLFRHTAAHLWLKDNGQEGSLMKRMGWSSRTMLDRYGSSMAEERAREEYRRLTPDDKIRGGG